MRTATDVAAGPDYAIRIVTCHDDHTRWSPAETRDEYNLVLAQRGRFRRRAGGVCADIDPTLGYVGTPGEQEHFAHPSGGDLCTWINLRPTLWDTLAGDAPLAGSTFYVDARTELTHRRMLAAARAGDGLQQTLLELFDDVLGQIHTRPTPADVAAHDTDRAIVSAAREAIHAGHPAAHALFPLAALLAVSPFRLSRAFSRQMGVSVTRYRNRVRVSRALQRLEQGDTSLALLAVDLGFADQAHLSRTVRQHLGHTPTALRRLLHGSD
ncbi:helix-turn-helix domain-containing protein [Actinomadura scrupuli]|uniref:helix-turn-helix domain-containing protein n=1 Tax=Actinomadura scrupuli TaxID=559629 RepID=UPI003D95806F